MVAVQVGLAVSKHYIVMKLQALEARLSATVGAGECVAPSFLSTAHVDSVFRGRQVHVMKSDADM